MTILVTGGAGYIGSVTVERLTKNGEGIVVLDDLSFGHREAIDAEIPFYQGAAGDQRLLTHIVKEHGIDSCMHCAALENYNFLMERSAAIKHLFCWVSRCDPGGAS